MEDQPNRHSVQSFFQRLDLILSRFEFGILILTLGGMVFIAFMQVILRNFFNFGIIWGDTLLRHLVLWVGFLGASLATREGRHISIDALARLFSSKWKTRIHIFTSLFSAFVCALLTRAAYVFVRDERAAETKLFLGIPLWLFMTVIVIGFMIITFRFLIKTIFPSISVEGSPQEE